MTTANIHGRTHARDVRDDEHPSVRASRALLEIVTLYPVLARCLVRDSVASDGRVTGTPERPLPYREDVSAMLGEVRHLARFLVQALVLDPDPKRRIAQGELPTATDEQIATVARHYAGRFAPDESADSLAFALDVENLAARAEAAAYPVGARWVTVPNRADEHASRRDPMPCAEPGCGGFYRMRLAAEARWGITVADPNTWPPLTCKADGTHIVTGVELARAVAWARANGTTHLHELQTWRAS